MNKIGSYVIALCDTRLIQRWDLATGERELTAPLPVEGMEVSPDGVLSWNVPQDLPEQSVSVIVTVSDAAGQERFHAFTLKMER